ncbi:MAG: helix-turn-helix domain-containing protein [Candidatus Curtissbacteria bacterium]|nr:helix-turn-helix domain-containing protein [Candidatus Curtissbacteria bacterium]
MKQLIIPNIFPKDFRQEDVKKIFGFVLTGRFCQLVCLPGVGKATLLRLIATHNELQKLHLGSNLDSTEIIYLDLHDLPSFERMQIEKFLLFALDDKVKPQEEPLLLSKQLARTFSNRLAKKQNIIFLFDHFDEFQNQLPTSFFQIMKGFKNLAKYKFASVFATRRDLKELIDPEILKEFYDLFIDNTVYLKVFDAEAVNVLFSQVENAFGSNVSEKDKKNILSLTGGHAKLTKVILELVLRENLSLTKEALLGKTIVLAAFYEIWLALTAQEQHAVQQIAQKKEAERDEVLENLMRFDLLQQFTFTIPLFEDFINNIILKTVKEEKITYDLDTREILKGTNIISDLLSKQEYRLLVFLIQNEGKIAERGEIIEAVWPDIQVQEGVSDEAIDQMVFRLRKKIEDEPNSPKHIITIKGRGLRFQP